MTERIEIGSSIQHHEDPDARIGETRLTWQPRPVGTDGPNSIELIRERYGLVRFESPRLDDDVETDESWYDWQRRGSIVIHPGEFDLVRDAIDETADD